MIYKNIIFGILFAIQYSSSIYAVHVDSDHVDVKEYLFLSNDNEGSQKIFNPLTVFLSGAYDIYQVGYAGTESLRGNNNPFQYDYKNNAENVYDNIAHPFEKIEKFGVKEFIISEIFPVSLDMERAQFAPNYQLHLIGGGVTYSTLEEWYEKRGVHHYKLMATINTLAYEIVNEIVENNDHRGLDVDPIADFWIFNPAGILLFQLPSVKNFFGTTLRGRDWSTMPYYNFSNDRLVNASQNYSFKVPLPKTDKLRMFLYFGMFSFYGLSYENSAGLTFSFGLGGDVGEIILIESETGEMKKTVKLDPAGGFFIDRDGTLLMSIINCAGRGERLKVNVFPNEYMYKSFDGGLYFGIDHDDKVTLGVIFSPAFIGIGM